MHNVYWYSSNILIKVCFIQKCCDYIFWLLKIVHAFIIYIFQHNMNAVLTPKKY